MLFEIVEPITDRQPGAAMVPIAPPNPNTPMALPSVEEVSTLLIIAIPVGWNVLPPILAMAWALRSTG